MRDVTVRGRPFIAGGGGAILPGVALLTSLAGACGSAQHDGARDGSMADHDSGGGTDAAVDVGGDGTTADVRVAYIVLDVQSADPAPLTPVSYFRVEVLAADGTMRTFAFAQDPPANLDRVTVTPLTVPLVESEIGPGAFEVDAYDVVGCKVATGSAVAVARPGVSTHVAVPIHTAATCVPLANDAAGGICLP
jgi:hypothetical protein